MCEYEFENDNYDVGHNNGINWKLVSFSFLCQLPSHVFSTEKKNQLESLKYQLSAWLLIYVLHSMDYHIILSIEVAIDYIKMILCASKLHVFNLVLIFCPDSTDVAKYNYVMMNTL